MNDYINPFFTQLKEHLHFEPIQTHSDGPISTTIQYAIEKTPNKETSLYIFLDHTIDFKRIMTLKHMTKSPKQLYVSVSFPSTIKINRTYCLPHTDPEQQIDKKTKANFFNTSIGTDITFPIPTINALLQISKFFSTTTKNSRRQVTFAPIDNGVMITYTYADTYRNDASTDTPYMLYIFSMNTDFKNIDLRFCIGYINKKVKEIPYIFYRTIPPLTPTYTSQKLIISGIMGSPKAGKSALINIIMNYFSHSKPANESAVIGTEYLQKYQLHGTYLQREFPWIKIMEFLDTRGRHFDVDDPIDVIWLKKFLDGIQTGSNLSKDVDIDTIVSDHENKVTHVLLPISIRHLGEYRSWLFFWDDIITCNEKIMKFIKLYHFIAEYIGTHNVINPTVDKKALIENATSRIRVILTHLDTVSNDDVIKKNVKQSIITQFRNGFPECGIPGISENYILFGEKECKWNQTKIKTLDKKLDMFLKTIDPKKDILTQYLERKKIDPELILEVPEEWCIIPNCKHNFTEDTVSNYIRIINDFNNNPIIPT